MTLYIRMAIYFLSALVAGQGLAVLDLEAGTVTFHIESLVTALTGTATFIGTYIVSRVAKARGGKT